MNISSVIFLSTLMACGEEEKSVDLSQYCGESDANNLIVDDADCDGAVTDDDCDDNDPNSLTVDEDGDCDGVLTADDCNDLDPMSSTVAEDGDCDGVLSVDDCDDSDATDASLSGDCDDDGYGQSVDCNDEDPNSTFTGIDADCDGVRTVEDCDDADASDAALSGDCDQDGVHSVDDCDDTDGSLLSIAEDPDCDGVIAAACGGALESEQDVALCYTDVDGDGYGDSNTAGGQLSPGCYFIEIAGESWGYASSDMHRIIGYEDGVIELWLEHDHYASTPDLEYEGQSTTYCPDTSTNLVELEFVNGNGVAEYEVYYDNGFETQFITSGTHSMGDHSILSEAWPTVNTMDVYGTDCDDADPHTHPGAAELDSSIACLTDADGDGYGAIAIQACYQMTLSDANFLGWDGNTIGVLEDGVMTETFTIDTNSSSVTHQHCASLSTQQVDFVFNEASIHNYEWFGSTGFTLRHQTDQGMSTIGTGGGSGSTVQTFSFDGGSFGDGEVFFSETAPFQNGLSTGGTDCDDTDPSVGSNVLDADCDGVND